MLHGHQGFYAMASEGLAALKGSTALKCHTALGGPTAHGPSRLHGLKRLYGPRVKEWKSGVLFNPPVIAVLAVMGYEGNSDRGDF